MTLVTIVQARMGSTRLPGKVLMRIGGRTILDHVIHRIRLCNADVGLVVVAAPASGGDNVIADHCKELGVPCYRSSEHDVLNRYQQAALNYRADMVLRVTADMPLICPELTAEVLTRDRGADYVTFADVPLGLTPERITAEALARCWRDATRDTEREHVTLHAINNPGRYSLTYLEPEDWLFDRRHWRLTLDTPDDFDLLERLYQLTGGDLFNLDTRRIVAAAAADREALSLATRQP